MAKAQIQMPDDFLKKLSTLGKKTDEIAESVLSDNGEYGELVRAGVDSDIAEGDSEIIETAIKTYALAYYASDVKDADRYNESFKYQCDCLRKSTFTLESENV